MISVNSPKFNIWSSKIDMKALTPLLVKAYFSQEKLTMITFVKKCGGTEQQREVGKNLLRAEMKLDVKRPAGTALTMVVLRSFFSAPGPLDPDTVKCFCNMHKIPYDPSFDLTTDIETSITDADLELQDPAEFKMAEIDKSAFEAAAEPASASLDSTETDAGTAEDPLTRVDACELDEKKDTKKRDLDAEADDEVDCKRAKGDDAI